jgi:hypothetical protein
MNRGDAYRVLAAEILSLSQQGYDSLASQVGHTTQRQSSVGQELLTIEILVRWDDLKKRTIRIDAMALGPSCWTLERLEESVVIRPLPLAV